MVTIDKLIKKVTDYSPRADTALIKKAYEFAEIAHAGQLRYSGDPYLFHCLEVADVLADLHVDTVSVAAGLMHDLIEKGKVTREEIDKEFGSEIGFLIESVTRIDNLGDNASEETRISENLRKMILAMSKDLRVVIIKIAEYLASSKTIHCVPEPKRQVQAKKIIDIFAPLADRLGMGEAKGQLEDLVFPALHPAEYAKLKDQTQIYYHQAGKFLEKVTRDLHVQLANEGVRASISSRPKHLYSLWKKLSRPEIDHDFGKIYDLVAMRVLVDEVKDCYTALGVVHRLWIPVTTGGGVRDYIANPKPNGYRSIHTNVLVQGRIVEIQIRTRLMHAEAENGVAAHWHYAQEKSKGADDGVLSGGTYAPVEKLSWVKQLVAWQNEIIDSKEYLEALKFDGLAHRIFVFTPKGDVYDLPLGSTPLDFAYEIHGDLGDQAVGAKINGKLCKLNQPLGNSDVVEIIKDEKTGPTQKWLSIVVTQKAKARIRKYLNKNKADLMV